MMMEGEPADFIELGLEGEMPQLIALEYEDGSAIWWVILTDEDPPEDQGCACGECAPHDQLDGEDPWGDCSLTTDAEAAE